jgi:hypothetical protein
MTPLLQKRKSRWCPIVMLTPGFGACCGFSLYYQVLRRFDFFTIKLLDFLPPTDYFLTHA